MLIRRFKFYKVKCSAGHTGEELLNTTTIFDKRKCLHCRRRAYVEGTEGVKFAKRFETIVVFENAETGEKWPAMTNDQPVPEGFIKHEITTRRAAEKVAKELNEVEREKFMRRRDQQMERSADFYKQQREEILQMRDEFENKALADFALQRLEQSYQNKQSTNFDAGVHFHALENDSSNVMAHRDPSKGWQGRR